MGKLVSTLLESLSEISILGYSGGSVKLLLGHSLSAVKSS